MSLGWISEGQRAGLLGQPEGSGSLVQAGLVGWVSQPVVKRQRSHTSVHVFHVRLHCSEQTPGACLPGFRWSQTQHHKGNGVIHTSAPNPKAVVLCFHG